MNNIGSITKVQTTVVESPQTTGDSAKDTSPEADVAGVPVHIPLSLGYSFSDPALQAAISKLEGKSPEVQQAISAAVSAFSGTNSTLAGTVNAALLNGLVDSVAKAPGKDLYSPFKELYAHLGECVQVLQTKTTEDAYLATLLPIVSNLLDLLQNSGVKENPAAVGEMLGRLAVAAQAKGEAPQAQKDVAYLAGMLHVALSVAAEGEILGNAGLKVVEKMWDFPLFHMQKDLVSIGENIVAKANLSLLLTLAEKLRSEMDARMEAAETDGQMMETMRKALLRQIEMKESMTKPLVSAGLIPPGMSMLTIVDAGNEVTDLARHFEEEITLSRLAQSQQRSPV